MRIFALSETVLRPDIYEAGFLAVSSGGADLGMVDGGDAPYAPEAGPQGGVGAPAGAAPAPMDAAADESPVPYAVAAVLALAALGAAVYWARKRRGSRMAAAVSEK